MIKKIVPILPMIDKNKTIEFYQNILGFILEADYGNFIILKKEGLSIYLFKNSNISVFENYSQVYIITENIKSIYLNIKNKNVINISNMLKIKPWGFIEFKIKDPNDNLITFGQVIKNKTYLDLKFISDD